MSANAFDGRSMVFAVALVTVRVRGEVVCATRVFAPVERASALVLSALKAFVDRVVGEVVKELAAGAVYPAPDR